MLDAFLLFILAVAIFLMLGVIAGSLIYDVLRLIVKLGDRFTAGKKEENGRH